MLVLLVSKRVGGSESTLLRDILERIKVIWSSLFPDIGFSRIGRLTRNRRARCWKYGSGNELQLGEVELGGRIWIMDFADQQVLWGWRRSIFERTWFGC